MKEIMVRVILMINFFMYLLGCNGCSNQQEISEDKIKFSTFSQEARKTYISNYLKENYRLMCNISEVKQKQISAVQNTEYYFATANTEDEDTISVWVSEDGTIIDSYCLVEMKQELNNHFLDKCIDIIPICKVKSYTEMREVPTEKLTVNMDVEEYMKVQPTFTYIRIFVQDERYVAEEVIDKLEAAFSGYDAKVYVYTCEDLSDIDVDSYDYSTYKVFKKIEKDE